MNLILFYWFLTHKNKIFLTEKCRYHTIFSDGTRDPAMDDTLLGI